MASRYPARVGHLILSCTSVGWGSPRHAARAAGFENRLNELGTLTAAEFGAARAPTMVISADKDQVASAAQADELVHMIEGCQNVILRGVGHAPYVEDPETYNATLRRFLAS